MPTSTLADDRPGPTATRGASGPAPTVTAGGPGTDSGLPAAVSARSVGVAGPAPAVAARTAVEASRTATPAAPTPGQTPTATATATATAGTGDGAVLSGVDLWCRTAGPAVGARWRRRLGTVDLVDGFVSGAVSGTIAVGLLALLLQVDGGTAAIDWTGSLTVVAATCLLWPAAHVAADAVRHPIRLVALTVAPILAGTVLLRAAVTGSVAGLDQSPGRVVAVAAMALAIAAVLACYPASAARSTSGR